VAKDAEGAAALDASLGRAVAVDVDEEASRCGSDGCDAVLVCCSFSREPVGSVEESAVEEEETVFSRSC
jgi:hypothetical protein